MPKVKLAIKILVYVLAIWHGFVVFARPLIHHHVELPFFGSVLSYSKVLLIEQSWAYFYSPPNKNIKVLYSSPSNPEVKKFFGSSSDYLEQRRYYRCDSCAKAAYQLYDNEPLPQGRLLIGHYLCPFQRPNDKLIIEVKEAEFDSEEFKTVKIQEILCSEYQNF